jgi:hypothetical protein
MAIAIMTALAFFQMAEPITPPECKRKGTKARITVERATVTKAIKKEALIPADALAVAKGSNHTGEASKRNGEL